MEKNNKCPECGGRVVSGTREKYCRDCGIVVNKKNRKPRWNIHDDHAKNVNLGTTVGSAKKDNYKEKDFRLNKQQKITASSDKKDIKGAKIKTKRLVQFLRLGNMYYERALKLYREVHEENLVSNKDVAVCACLYTVCRKNKIRSLSEISDEAGVLQKKVYQKYLDIKRNLDVQAQPYAPKDYLPKIANDLNVDGKTRRKAKKILQDTSNSGKDSKTTAAAALLVAKDSDVDENDVKGAAEAAGANVSTVVSRQTELKNSVKTENL